MNSTLPHKIVFAIMPNQNIKSLLRRGVHNVPKHTIQNMKHKLQNWLGETLKDATKRITNELSITKILLKRRKCIFTTNCRAKNGINCIGWHDTTDKIRTNVQIQPYIKHNACPNVWDYEKKMYPMINNINCRETCNSSHNFFESWYHPNIYKQHPCPFLQLNMHYYQSATCPYVKTIPWFRKMEKNNKIHIKKIDKENKLILLQDGRYLALDYCPFKHDIL